MGKKKVLRFSIYRSLVAAVLGCGLATALVVISVGELLFREAYAAARESSLAEARARFAIYDFIVAGQERLNRASSEAALRELGRRYPDVAAIGRASAAELRAAAEELGVSEIYLVGPDGHILATSFAPDFGLDILAAGKKSAAALRALYGSGKMAHQGLSHSARTGLAASYHYHSPADSEVIVEASTSLRDSIDASYPGGYAAFLGLVLGGPAPSAGTPPLVRIDDLVGLAGGWVWSFAREGVARPALLPLVSAARAAGKASSVQGRTETLVLHVEDGSPGSDIARESRFAVLAVDLRPIERFRVLVGLAAAAACLLSSVAAFRLAKHFLDRDVAGRVERLEASMSRIAIGDFGPLAEGLGGGGDEIDAIAQGVAGMVRTITERNEELSSSLAEKEELLREVHHRVKNNLQVIASLVSLQISESGDAAVSSALAATRARVHGMALVHDELYKGASLVEVDLGSCLEGIAADAEQGRRRAGLDVETRIDGGGLVLPADKALPACLAATELLANCYAHAFEGRGRGLVVARASGSTGLGFELSVEDDGRGAGEGPPREGLGLGIARALAAQLGGELRREASALGGERFVVAVPPAAPKG